MTITERNPVEMPIPATYHNGVEVSSDARTLYVAGQIGMEADGSIPEGIVAQTKIAVKNVGLILASAGMSIKDVVKATYFLTDPADLAEFAKTRGPLFEGHKVAATLVFVSQLVNPKLRVEIEVVAAQ